MSRGTAKGRGRRRSFAALLVVAVAVVVFGLLAAQALSLPGFNVVMNGIGPCDSCHGANTGVAQVHPPSNPIAGTNTNHEGVGCPTCHVNGTAQPPTPAACVTCHPQSAIMTEVAHTSQGCASTPGCHGVPNPVTPKITVAVAPKVIKFKKTVTVSGTITPNTLTAKTVALTVQRKVGTKWVQAKVGATAVTTISTSRIVAMSFCEPRSW